MSEFGPGLSGQEEFDLGPEATKRPGQMSEQELRIFTSQAAAASEHRSADPDRVSAARIDQTAGVVDDVHDADPMIQVPDQRLGDGSRLRDRVASALDHWQKLQQARVEDSDKVSLYDVALARAQYERATKLAEQLSKTQN